MINSSRETVCRMLTQLRRKGVISVRGAKLRIVDAQALETICSTNHIDAQPEQAARRPHSISA
jgi:DNA-binding transcriptional regulator YhcF (GntR family)